MSLHALLVISKTIKKTVDHQQNSSTIYCSVKAVLEEVIPVVVIVYLHQISIR